MLALWETERAHMSGGKLERLGMAIRNISCALWEVSFGLFSMARRLLSGRCRRSARRALLAGCDGQFEESLAKVLR